jgi:photosystem II stability/assembly factor-like uncharacterized protein
MPATKRTSSWWFRATIALGVASMTLAATVGAAPSLSGAQPGTTTPVLERIAFFNPHRGYGLFRSDAGTCQVDVARTTDGGREFGPLYPVTSCAATPTETPVRSLAFDDHGDGFAYGPDLFVTHDAGQTWTQSVQPGSVVAVAALGESVWALEGICPTGVETPICPFEVFESSDGGRSWTPSPAQPVLSTRSAFLGIESAQGQSWLVRVSATSAYVLAPPTPFPGGRTDVSVPLAYTDDGGQTWLPLQIPCGMDADSAVLSSAPDGALMAVCAGLPSAGSQPKSVAVSTDGGRIWTVHNPCPDGFLAPCSLPDPLSGGYLDEVDATSAETAYVIGSRGLLLATHDGGLHWHVDRLVGDLNGLPAQVVFFNPSDGVVLGRRTTAPATVAIWTTSDAGRRWSRLTPSVSVWRPGR